MSLEKENIKMEIENLQRKLKEVETKEKSLEEKRLEEFKEIGMLLKTRNFFGVDNDHDNNFYLYVLKENEIEASKENAERVFIIEDVTEMMLEKGETP